MKKVTELLSFMSCDYLLAAFIYTKGHPVAAGIVATVLLTISVFSVFKDHPFSGLSLPDGTLMTDAVFMVLAILYICAAGMEQNQGVFLPFMVLGFVGFLSHFIHLIQTGACKDRSFKELFHEQLRLPITLDIILLFWPVYTGIKDGWETLGTAGFAVMGILILDLLHNILILPAVIRKDKQIVTDYLRELECEKEALASLDTETEAFDEETKRLLEDRIELIDRILIGKMTGNAVFNHRADKDIEKVITDRTAFIESLALRFSFSHPRAIEELQQRGLSRYEIGLCCLYFMGYYGKEVKDISGTSMVYHVNSAIRQKLGLNANDVNLSTYIRDLFGAA